MGAPIVVKRFQQAAFEAIATMNRPAGSGGGSGLTGFVNVLGFAAAGNQGAYSTANSSTFSDITNTTFTFQISRATFFEYQIIAAAHLSAAGALGYIRGNIVSFDTSANILFGSTSTVTSPMNYFPTTKGLLQPGLYTAKLQAATDNNTFSITVDEFFHYLKVFAA